MESSSNEVNLNGTIVAALLTTLIPDVLQDDSISSPLQHLYNNSSSNSSSSSSSSSNNGSSNNGSSNNGSSSSSSGQNLTSEVPVDVYSLPMAFLWVYFALRILWGFLAMFGNTLTIAVVTKYKAMRTPNNFLICSLAAADLLAAVITPLMMLHQLYPNSSFYTAVCLTERGLSLLSTLGNMISILYIAINSYIFFAFPLRYKGFITHTRTFVVIGMTWVALVSALLLLFSLSSHVEVGIECNRAIFADPNVFYFILAPYLCIVPAITVGFYIGIAKIARKQGMAVAALQQPYDTIEASTSRSSKKICKMLGLVLGLYFLSLAPTYILSAILHARKLTKTLLIVQKVTVLIFWANTWMNPLIYAWRFKQFRIAFGMFLLGRGTVEDFIP